MDCFDSVFAYANMQTHFYETLNSIFSKNISEIHETAKFCLQFPYIPVLVNL